jgi:hypothetical protein
MDKIMNKFSVSDMAWVPKALKAIDLGEGVCVSVTGPDAKLIMQHVQDITARLPIMSLFNAVQRFVPAVGAVHIDPLVVVPVLASLGALGAAAGSVAFVAGVGVAHGMKLAFTYDMGSLLDPMDDALSITLTK